MIKINNIYSLKKLSIIVFTFCLLTACETYKNNTEEFKKHSEQLFHSVYGGNLSEIDSLISDDIVASYPIFEQIFGSKSIQGREAYKNFAIGFNKRWTDAKINIHETIAEDKSVVLVWSFSAKRIKTEQDTSEVEKNLYSWDGITLYHFNEMGEVISETGKEGSPKTD
ncbi:nuclear transport factor 2 family protein [Parvicella tangerina]|uniref:SnoaL-like domain-containing protein n=1 Tax=Parvicella tangerina TaxID=2829795 RepID=A0A916NJW3_9FLAO|nr:nuclear transport factor 2 family protein [Parvicella tangerina]CAG5087748.1 hypothetical protein CRYO30217_03569 [Parvicella tangerina]